MMPSPTDCPRHSLTPTNPVPGSATSPKVVGLLPILCVAGARSSMKSVYGMVERSTSYAFVGSYGRSLPRHSVPIGVLGEEIAGSQVRPRLADIVDHDKSAEPQDPCCATDVKQRVLILMIAID